MTIKKPATFLRSVFCFTLSAISLIVSTAPVSALSLDSELFIQNDILFYDPSPIGQDDYNSENNCIDLNHGATIFNESNLSNAKLVWNYLVQYSGISDPAALAGVMGNIKQESDFNPFEKTGQYYGLYQFSFKDYSDFEDRLKKEDLLEYFDQPGKKPADIIKKAIKVELDFLLKSDRWKKQYIPGFNYITNKTPASYAELFVATVERAVETAGKNPNNTIIDKGVQGYINQHIYKDKSAHTYHDSGYQQIDKRRNYAEEFFKNRPTALANSTPNNSINPKFNNGWLTNLNIQTDDYTKTPSSSVPSESFSTKPNKIILHYVSPSLPSKTSHFTIDPKKRSGFQHFPLDKPALALRNNALDSAGVISIAIKTPSIAALTTDDYKYLALIIKSITNEAKISTKLHDNWTTSAPIIKSSDFNNYTGIIGRLHVPTPDRQINNPGDIKSALKTALNQNLTDPKILTSSENPLVDCDTLPGSTEKIIEELKKLGDQGLTLDQAKKFMDTYKQLAKKPFTKINTDYSIKHVRSDGHSQIYNCVAFIYYFLNGFGTKRINVLNNGRDVTNTLSGSGFAYSKKPKPYAIFSTVTGKTLCGNQPCGHTGVILGIQNNKYIIGEASFYHVSAGVRFVDIDKFHKDKTLSFAYFTPDQTKITNAINGILPK